MTVREAILRASKELPATREYLSVVTRYCDRAVRYEIRDLRRQGIPVISLSDKKGYYIAESEAEVFLLLSELRHRANDLLETCAKISQRSLNEIL